MMHDKHYYIRIHLVFNFKSFESMSNLVHFSNVENLITFQ
jgi:hypothetical protein